MLSFIRKLWHQRIIDRSSITQPEWDEAISSLELLNHLPTKDKEQLRNLAILFLHQKSFYGAQGLSVSQDMRLLVALQACLPILKLGIDWYRKWTSIIIYPTGFTPDRTITDETGLVHRVQQPLSGEAWLRGPVILSWSDTESAGERDGSNVVIHEFVHKLDMLNGSANGFPPLQGQMKPEEWSATFTAAYEDFQSRVNRNQSSGINSYAATSPAEFIAVLSEVFFERPQVILEQYPDVYKKLKRFYRQDPIRPYQSY